jgi:tripeptide aminopeptidase
MDRAAERFIKYVKINTRSDESSSECPSSLVQWDLARPLERELKSLGLSDVKLDKNCYLTATLPSNSKKKLPVLGLIAHMDTSPDMTGVNVKPNIVKNYSGGDIVLNSSDKTILSPEQFPELLNYIGDDLITTDGTTLLGADNKAGIAEIITAIEYLLSNPDIEHGEVRIGFTPDEEIGRGADKFDVERFGADFAFTIDGGEIGELEFENFNAALAVVNIKGRNVHPGTAKDQMVNSMLIASEFIGMVPASERPEHTSGYEGFFHLVDFDGTVEESQIRFLIRDHDRLKFEDKKETLKSITDQLNKRDKSERVVLKIKDQYYNMREKVEPHYHIIELAAKAMEQAGVTPKIKPIRGGTDGARLSFMGLPCPNIFTGGHNFHGRYEYISIQSMNKAVETIVNIIKSIPINY